MENERLATQPVPKLLLNLAAPAICAQFVTLLYNLVDRIYIGRMEDGALAMAAVGICAPIVTVVTAFTGLLGRGGSPLAAIRMGEGNQRAAEAVSGQQRVHAHLVLPAHHGNNAGAGRTRCSLCLGPVKIPWGTPGSISVPTFWVQCLCR